MKLLYYSELFWPHIGGIELLSLQLLPALKHRGYEIAVVTSHQELELPDYEEHLGIPIYRFRLREAVRDRDPAKILRTRSAVAELRSQFRPDVAHINFSGPLGFFHLTTTEHAPSPWILATHTSIPTAADERGLILRLMDRADWITSNSGAMLDRLKMLDPSIQDRSSVILNGLEPPGLDPAPLPFSPPKLLCLGRLLEKKGFDVLLDACPSLLERFPDLRVVIAGDGADRADLEARASALGLCEAVEFTGWIPPERVFQLINECTAVVIPSRWEEPFCLVAVQAGLMRRPVIASHVGGLGEVVSDGETGILVPKEDPEALGAAVASLLERPDRATAYGEAGQVRAARCFSLDRYVDEYDALYRKMATARLAQAEVER